MNNLLPVAEALSRILSSANVVAEPVELPLLEAQGLVLAEDVISRLDVPPLDNSAMDGYALRASEAKNGLAVSQRIPAGTVGNALTPESAARIFTGAAIPPGADAVVMQENCSEEQGVVTVSGPVTVGAKHPGAWAGYKRG